jgi:hypothetical protein
MKKQTGIWIDSTKAIFVTLAGGKETVSEIESDVESHVHHNGEGDSGTFMGTSHLNHERKFEERKKHQFDHFIKEVLDKVHDHDEIYVFGPAETKLLLKEGLSEHHELSGKLKSCETSDSMTMNQVVAKVKDFFKP